MAPARKYLTCYRRPVLIMRTQVEVEPSDGSGMRKKKDTSGKSEPTRPSKLVVEDCLPVSDACDLGSCSQVGEAGEPYDLPCLELPR